MLQWGNWCNIGVLKTTPRSSPTYLAANDWHLMVDPHIFCHTWNREWHGKMISIDWSFFLFMIWALQMAGLLQRGQSLINKFSFFWKNPINLKRPAFCMSLLEMVWIIRMGRLFAKREVWYEDFFLNLNRPTLCRANDKVWQVCWKWSGSSGLAGLLDSLVWWFSHLEKTQIISKGQPSARKTI